MSATTCFVGGGQVRPGSATEHDNGNFIFDPVLLSTTDGGAHWSLQPVPAPQVWPGGLLGDTLAQVACSSETACVVTVNVPYLLPDSERVKQQSQNGFTVAVLGTTDGGAHWSQTYLPGISSPTGDVGSFDPTGTSPAELSCPTPQLCLTTAVVSLAHGGRLVSLAWRSADGGTTWSEVQPPSGTTFSWVVSCASASQCWIPGTRGAPGQAVGEMLRSSDGGASWSAEAPTSLATYPNSTVSAAESMSCPNSQDCWVAAGAAAAGEQAPIIVTTDGGKTWGAATLPPPASTKDRIIMVPAISCAAPSSCVALGIAASNPSITGEGVAYAAQTEVVLASHQPAP